MCAQIFIIFGFIAIYYQRSVRQCDTQLTHRLAGRQAKELNWTALLVEDKTMLWPIHLKKPILLIFLRVPLFRSPFYYCCKWSKFLTACAGCCLRHKQYMLKHLTIYAKRLMSCFGSTILLPLLRSVHMRLFLQYLFSQCLWIES